MTTPLRSLSRRQFLRGASGFMLALPALSSLLPSQTRAEPAHVRKPRLWWLTTNHGGAVESAFFPSVSGPTETRALFADHTITAGALRATAAADVPGHAALSPILRAPAALLSERRVAQLNVLRGIDIAFGIGHHTGGHLGNYAYNEAVGGIALELHAEPRPTIDQLLAWSPSFYGELAGVRERALVLGSRAISFGYEKPSTGTGGIQNIRGTDSSLELFHRLFTPDDALAAGRVPVVDRVLESYKRLRNGDRRLSHGDRQRLDDHMDRVSELQRKLNVAFPSACGAAPPSDDSALHARPIAEDGARYAELHNEVVATAFTCGLSRIAVLGLSDAQRFADFAGDWHSDVAHYWLEPDKQQLLARAYQQIFERVFLDMAARLDVEEEGGFSYLDNTLLVWSHESGMSTHDPVSLPIVTAGSAGGAVRTGLSIDYRRAGHLDSRFQPLSDAEPTYAGLLHNQFLAAVLQAMGMPAVELERWGHKGYGVPRVERGGVSLPFAAHYGDTGSRYFQIASDPLPFFQG